MSMRVERQAQGGVRANHGEITVSWSFPPPSLHSPSLFSCQEGVWGSASSPTPIKPAAATPQLRATTSSPGPQEAQEALGQRIPEAPGVGGGGWGAAAAPAPSSSPSPASRAGGGVELSEIIYIIKDTFIQNPNPSPQGARAERGRLENYKAEAGGGGGSPSPLSRCTRGALLPPRP